MPYDLLTLAPGAVVPVALLAHFPLRTRQGLAGRGVAVDDAVNSLLLQRGHYHHNTHCLS